MPHNKRNKQIMKAKGEQEKSSQTAQRKIAATIAADEEALVNAQVAYIESNEPANARSRNKRNPEDEERVQHRLLTIETLRMTKDSIETDIARRKNSIVDLRERLKLEEESNVQSASSVAQGGAEEFKAPYPDALTIPEILLDMLAALIRYRIELTNTKASIKCEVLAAKSIIMSTFKDLRQFNRKMYADLVACGYWELLGDKLRNHRQARTRQQQLSHILTPYNYANINLKAETKLTGLVEGVVTFMHLIDRCYGTTASDSDQPTRMLGTLAVEASESHPYYGHRYLLNKFKGFLIYDGVFQSMASTRRHQDTLLYDQDARLNMIRWMSEACRAKPPTGAQHFAQYVHSTFKCRIAVKTAQTWLNKLGFKSGDASGASYYDDGQQRRDVKEALRVYSTEMDDLDSKTRAYYGPDMAEWVEPTVELFHPITGKKLNQTRFWHDESSGDSADSASKVWKLEGVTGKCKAKRGEACMVAAYVSPDLGNIYYIITIPIIAIMYL
jgi:hypothetical protein